MNYKKIVIVGKPGCGKSTFALQLGAILNIPVHHLDKHIFVEDGKKRNKDELLANLQAIINEDSWIIEGCSITTLESRFAQADAVFYFQFSTLLCVWRVFKRQLNKDGIQEKSGCIPKVNRGLLKYIWDFDTDKEPIILRFQKKYPHVNFHVFSHSTQPNLYLNSIKII